MVAATAHRGQQKVITRSHRENALGETLERKESSVREGSGAGPGSGRAIAAEEADGGAEDVRGTEAAGLGHHDKVGTLTPDQAAPGDAGLHLASEEDAVGSQGPAGGDGNIAAAEDQRAQLLTL